MKIIHQLYIFIEPGVQRMIDHLASITIIAVLVILMIHAYLPLVTRTKVLSGTNYGLEKSKRHIAYHWALHGAWPKNNAGLDSLDTPYSGKNSYVKETEIQDGAIQIAFNHKLARKRISCRPAIPANDKYGPVQWVCGPPLDPSGWVFQGKDRTSIGNYYIPESLR
jgi:hypothetical protein